MIGRELEHKMNEEFIKFKFKADEHMANMVSEDKFKQALQKTVNLKDHQILNDKVRELNQVV